MKSTFKLIMCMALMLVATAMYAQVPQMFNYQGIARDAKGNPLANQQMSLKLSVLPTSDASIAEYEEIQKVTTNEFGLYTLQIGNGTPVSGEMKNVKWETGNKYIKVAIDAKGGNDYVEVGTSQLLSVPYAIYADHAGSSKEKQTRAGAVNTAAGTTGNNNMLAKFTSTPNTITNSIVFDNGTRVGIGTTTPSARLQVSQDTNIITELVRMRNTHTDGAGRFTMYSDAANNYATFTKYGSSFVGGYPGIAALYPYGNLLAFGNNGIVSGDGLGRFLISSGGNIGISLFKSGVSRLKFHADFATENVGIGGSATPAARVHLNNTDGTVMELMMSSNNTGHTNTDGFVIQQSGANVNMINKENGDVRLWSNNTERVRVTAGGNVGVGTTTPAAALDVNGQIRMQGGAPGLGKIMTSNATGVGSWSTAAAAGLVSGSGTLNYVPKFTPNGNTLGNSNIIDDGTNVGLGIATPVFPLHQNVEKNALTGGNVDVSELGAKFGNMDETVGSAVGIGFGKSGVLENIGAAIIHERTGSQSNGKLHFATKNSGVLGEDIPVRMTLDQDGKLGISTMNPNTYLQINNNTVFGDNTGSANIYANHGSAFGNTLVAESNDSGTETPAVNRFSTALLAGIRTAGPVVGNVGVTGHAFGTGAGGWGGLFSAGADIATATRYVALGGDALRPLASFQGGNVIMQGGSVGIGLNNPTSILHVRGLDTRFDNGLFQMYNSTGTNYGFFVNPDFIGDSYFGTGMGYAGKLHMYNDGGARMTLLPNGNIGINNMNPTARLDVAGTVKIADGSEGNNKVLKSDATGNASWVNANTLPGSIAATGFINTNSLNPAAAISFITNIRVQLNITSATQVVMISGTVTLGSNIVGGADGLNLYCGYNTTNLVTPVTTIGAGTFGLRCVQNTRQTYTVHGRVTGLAPGTYYFGVVGNCTTTPANWNNNEFGDVMVTIINQ